MKRIVLIISVLSVFVVPALAQGTADINTYERMPVVTAVIPGSELPAKVVNAVNTRFDKDNPLTWSKFPYEFKDYGWVYEVGSSSSDLNQLLGYKVIMRTTQGNNLQAFYNANGNLTETRERSKNIALPRYVREALATGEYKDWKAIGDKELIQFYRPDEKNPYAQQVFKVTLQKDKEKRKLTFKYEASTGKLQAIVRR